MRRIVVLSLAVLLVTGILIAGCSSIVSQKNAGNPESVVPVASSPQGPALKETVWQLTSYAGTDGTLVPVRNATGATAIFSGNNEFRTYIGCSQYAAPYTLDESSLTIGPFVSTKISCAYPEGLSVLEERFLTLVHSARSLGIADGKLSLRDGTDGTVLVFSPQLVSSSLPGTKWNLHSYLDSGGAPRAVLTGTEITVDFGVDGQLTGFSGCNRYSAGYRVNGSSLTTGQIAATTLSCTSPLSTNEQENRVFALFPMASGYAIEGNQLILKDASGQVLMIMEMG